MTSPVHVASAPTGRVTELGKLVPHVAVKSPAGRNELSWWCGLSRAELAVEVEKRAPAWIGKGRNYSGNPITQWDT